MSKKYDYEKGNSRWHIFDASGNNMLKVYHQKKTDEFEVGHKCIIHSFIDEPYSWVPSNFVWLVWWDINDSNRYGSREYWNVHETFKWLTEEFFPFAVYNFNKPYRRTNWFIKKELSYEEYKKDINVKDYYFEGENRYYSIGEVNNLNNLMDIVESLNVFYSTRKEVCINKTDIIMLLDSIIQTLDICSNPDYYYVCTKLGIQSTENKEEITDYINREKGAHSADLLKVKMATE